MKKRKDIADELQQMVPGENWPAETPGYEVPAGYFEQLPGHIMQQIKALEAPSVQQELDEIAPLLAQLHKQHPYSVPAGYFDALPEQVMAAIPVQDTAKVVRMPFRKTYWKWAVAAAITASIAVSTMLFINNNGTGNNMEAQLAAISDQAMMDYLQTYEEDNDPIFVNVAQQATMQQEQSTVDALPTAAIEQYLENSDLTSEVPSNE